MRFQYISKATNIFLGAFQFSLWDSMMKKTLMMTKKNSFNSLYEIHQSISIEIVYSFTLLSILFMRFKSRVYWEVYVRRENFQFSLWDSLPLNSGFWRIYSLSILFMRFPSENTKSGIKVTLLSILFMRFFYFRSSNKSRERSLSILFMRFFSFFSLNLWEV